MDLHTNVDWARFCGWHFAVFHQTEPQVTHTIHTSTIILTSKHTCDLIHNYSGHKIRFDLIRHGKTAHLLCIKTIVDSWLKQMSCTQLESLEKQHNYHRKLPFIKSRSTKKGKNGRNRRKKSSCKRSLEKNCQVVTISQFIRQYCYLFITVRHISASLPSPARSLARFSFIFLSSFSSLVFHLLFHNVVIILTSSNYNLLIFVLTHFARNP